jgi:hypothetical protein
LSFGKSSGQSSKQDFPYREFLKSTSSYDTIGLCKPLINWDKPTPIWKLLKQCGKTADRAEKFLKKINSAQVSSGYRARLVPANATIRRKYIKCGKTLCRRTHGSYYYAYWKDDTANGKLKKKYIGNKCGKMNVSTAISTVEIMNADKDVDTDKLLDSNNKILDSPNNLDKVKSGQKTKKQKKDTPLLFVSN